MRFGNAVRYPSFVAQIKSQQECFYDGQFSSSNIDMPSEMYPDQKGEVRVTLRNVGTCTWNPRDIELRVTIKKALVVLLFSGMNFYHLLQKHYILQRPWQAKAIQFAMG